MTDEPSHRLGPCACSKCLRYDYSSVIMTSAGEHARATAGEAAPRSSTTNVTEAREDGGTDEFGLSDKPPTTLSNASSPDDSEDEAAFHDAEEATEHSSPKPANRELSLGLEGIGQANMQEHKDSEQANISSRSRTPPILTTKPPEHTHLEESPVQGPLPAESVPTNAQSGPQNTTSKDPKTTTPTTQISLQKEAFPSIKKDRRTSGAAVSEWSHQKLAPRNDESDDEEEEVSWQAMPALGEFDIYNDVGRMIAKGQKEGDVAGGYAAVGAAGKGYTRVQLDEDAQSATSMDEDTSYLFKQEQKSRADEPVDAVEDDDEQRDAAAQLENTKDLLTEGQRIAYVGVVRLTIHKMLKAVQDMERTRYTKKEIDKALESMELWGQKMMVRLYGHMEIESAEQLMIEQLAEHGVQPSDLIPPLMHNARVKNPMADAKAMSNGTASVVVEKSTTSVLPTASDHNSTSATETQQAEEVPEIPDEMPKTENLELDIRWTVLCDLFLVLISDSGYDARSRRLLERVASSMQISWLQICRFEKRVIDALEMQEDTTEENHDETTNMESRRKLALKKKYVYMGLATVGGGLVIGLSAGLLAPVIGAGLAAGFTTIGVGGTAGFLGGVGGAALITSIGIGTGGTIAVRASNRRTGHVKTFEYRPLHNNKRLNLILTVSGWMNGKVDDVRLPYSTVDPIMGDIYSLFWEPEMLQSMGETISVLATEALTQTVQQVLGSTILIGLMASIQLPIVLTKLSYLIDNPWSVSLDRATSAGLILADSLMQKHLGDRPITLVGFSLGARVLFTCLKELSSRGAYGLVQNVYLFGSPLVASKDEYLRARSVISGRFVNGYASNDWILGYLFRATSGGIGRVAGLAAVEGVPGLENKDLSELVNGHMAYRAAMPRLLREVGWEVESDEFTEIEDPDPENHEKRQRELIREIDSARKQAEEKPEKKRFSLFKRGRLAEKKEWEKYDLGRPGLNRSFSERGEVGDGGNEPNVLFDIDAIRKELESEMIEVRELESSLPPMQITSVKNGEKHVEYLRLPPEVELSKGELPYPLPIALRLDAWTFSAPMMSTLCLSSSHCHLLQVCRS